MKFCFPIGDVGSDADSESSLRSIMANFAAIEVSGTNMMAPRLKCIAYLSSQPPTRDWVKTGQ